MSLKNSFKTVAHEAETVLIREKSKFIAHVAPASNEKAALDYLASIRSAYPDARHNVYAYVIDENNIFRYSDDGEPSGTAGMPVLDAIRKRSLVDVVIVVTRYFGGVLLGTGGLVHAYGTAASQGLEKAQIVTRRLCSVLDVKADYDLVGKMQYRLMSHGLVTLDTIYDSSVTFVLACPKEDTADAVAAVTEMTNGRAQCRITGERYIDDDGE